METKEWLKSMEGRDEDGQANAVCTVQILKVEPESETGLDVVREASTTDGEVEFHIVPGGMSEIGIGFDNDTDYDFLQISEVCQEYSRRDGESDEDIILALTIAPAGVYDQFLSVLCQSWHYNVPSPDKPCNGIGFIAVTDYISVVDGSKNRA